MITNLKIALAQLNPLVGDVIGNVDKLISARSNLDNSVDILVAPELYISGYPIDDLVLREDFLDLVDKGLENLSKATKDCKSSIIVGAPRKEENTIRNQVLTVFGNLPYNISTEILIKWILNLNDKKMSKKDSFIRACEALNKVSIRDPERILESYPFQLSGGLAQRVVITMAMINKPELLLADEPSTALDVTIQNQALDLMDDLTRETNTAVLLITHNMGVVRKFAEKVYVIYRGVIVEEGTKKQLFKNPGHPYTKALLESIPKLSGDGLPTHDNNPPDYALIPKYVH